MTRRKSVGVERKQKSILLYPLFVNATGEKMPAIVIGKQKHRDVLKDSETRKIPMACPTSQTKRHG